MGMDPSVHMWVGIKDESEFLISEAVGKLPDYLLNEDKQLIWKPKVKEYGFELSEFFSGDECVGLGVEIMWTDWDDGVIPFDPEWQAKAQELLPKVKAFFNKYAIMGEVGFWLVTNYG